MRTYAQFCAVAKGLDVIGDRWTLLIVRELLVRGPSRYTDIRAGLPGIASNLLADRLRTLQDHGLVASSPAVPPVATPLLTLTQRGRALEPVLAAIGRWGAPLLGPGMDDTFQSHWLILPIQLELVDRFPDRPAITVEVRTGDEALAIHAGRGVVTVIAGVAVAPAAVIAGPPPAVVALLLGGRHPDQLASTGLVVSGDATVLERLRPRREQAPGTATSRPAAYTR